MQKRKHPPRNNEFYEKHLKRKNPRVYRQWMDGKFPNLQQALIAAEIKRKPTPLDLMFRGWRKATEEQRLPARLLRLHHH
jgi:hypothetical protein